MLVVDIRGLSKAYNRRPVFSGVSERVSQGEALAIIGPNGSGKSTLIRCVTGLTRPTAGDIIIHADGRSYRPGEVRHLLGVVAPDIALYSELTGLENLAFFARVRGIGVSTRDLTLLLERVGLAGYGGDILATYSSGMRQRLKYACALLHHPRILVLDEPGSYLDSSGLALVQEIMTSYKRTGVLIFATNDPQEVPFGDRILRLGE